MVQITLTPDELISSSRAASELSRLLNQLPQKKWFIQRNNRLEAVLLGIDEYQQLLELEEQVEHLTLALLLSERERQDDGYRIGLNELATLYDVPE